MGLNDISGQLTRDTNLVQFYSSCVYVTLSGQIDFSLQTLGGKLTLQSILTGLI
jgi:hypothetical protein